MPRRHAPEQPGTSAGPAPELVVLHVWALPARALPGLLARSPLDRRAARAGGASFTKLLGTGSGRAFTPRDADLGHWGLLTAWPRARDAQAFEESPAARRWTGASTERLRVELAPLASRGTWAGRRPFGEPGPPRGAPDPHGPVASITRARLRPTRAHRFWRAVPPVADDLARADGLRLALGVGEAPVLLMGTFSLWRDAAALSAFAHAGAPHRRVMAATPREGWYAEELFARFAVLGVEGTHGGRRP